MILRQSWDFEETGFAQVTPGTKILSIDLNQSGNHRSLTG